MSIRIERLKKMIREESADLITSHLNDPRIGFCTVTKVDLTNDLAFATVYVSVFGDEAQKRTTLRGLQGARGLIQRQIAARLTTRTTPHIDIKLDESIERSFHILDKIKEARASDPDGGKDTALPPAKEEEQSKDDGQNEA
jgi:ribosome-binding factor A